MKGKSWEIVKKYRLPLLVLVVGIVLMTLPLNGKKVKEETAKEEGFSLTDTEEKMADMLGKISGVGKVRVMLTLESGMTLQLARDKDLSERENERKEDEQVVKINRGSGTQEVVVTHEIYPKYLGAVVVCDGADHPAVRLAVTESIAVLTGLSSEKITVEKWNEKE